MNRIRIFKILLLFTLAVLFQPVEVFSQDIPAYLNDKAREKFKTYRDKPIQRAYAYSFTGAFGFGYGFQTVQKARDQALSECENYSDLCKIIAVNKKLIERKEFIKKKSPPKKKLYFSNQLFSKPFFYLLFTLLGLLFLVIYFRYKNYMASPDQRADIRSRSLEITDSKNSLIGRIENYAKKQNWIQVHTVKGNVVVLESFPGFINNGYFFRIKLESVDPDHTKLQIGCRPRVALQFWHLYATDHTDRLKKELQKSINRTNSK